jgi:hypothetical protein
MSWCAVFVAAALLLGDERQAAVGMPLWIRDLVLPGPELEVAPAGPRAPVMLRIADVRPHGTSFRYDLVVYGMEPGTHDLRDALVRRDGTPAAGLQPLPVVIASVLPPGRVQPNRPERGELPPVGGYGTLLWIAGAAWCVGLWALLRLGRPRRAAGAHEVVRPQTVADRLRPLVEKAVAGRLSGAERAQLELTLIAFWRTRLDLHGVGTAAALTTLREHERAGPLLRRIEDWLHRREPPRDVDIAELLAPYRAELADAGT